MILKLHIECSSPIYELIPSLAELTLSTAVPGNSVEVLENGAFFHVLLEGIQAAQKSVHLETFLWEEGVLRRRGVRLRVKSCLSTLCFGGQVFYFNNQRRALSANVQSTTCWLL